MTDQTLFPLPQHTGKKLSGHTRLKCGVPPTMLSVIRSFYEGMQAGVRVGSTVTKCFEVQRFEMA